MAQTDKRTRQQLRRDLLKLKENQDDNTRKRRQLIARLARVNWTDFLARDPAIEARRWNTSPPFLPLQT